MNQQTRRPHAPKGTRVAVIRWRHGWFDGSIHGVLIDDMGTVRVDSDDPDWPNAEFHCEHRRDYRILDEER